MLRQNGRLIGGIPDLRKLPQQQKGFHLPDGSVLKIEIFYTGSVLFDFSLFLNDHLLVCREKAVRSQIISCCTILFMAGVNALAGLLYLFDQLNSGSISLVFLGAGLFSFVSGGAAAIFIVSAIYLILSWQVWRRSWIALIIAIGLVGLDSAYLVFALIRSGGEAAVFIPPLLLSRLMVLIAIAAGLEGLEKLQTGNLTTSNLAPFGILRVKRITVNILALLLDPISWIFNRMNRNGR